MPIFKQMLISSVPWFAIYSFLTTSSRYGCFQLFTRNIVNILLDNGFVVNVIDTSNSSSCSEIWSLFQLGMSVMRAMQCNFVEVKERTEFHVCALEASKQGNNYNRSQIFYPIDKGFGLRFSAELLHLKLDGIAVNIQNHK